MSIDLDIVLDLEAAEKAANKFQDDFVSSLKNAAAQGEGAIKEFSEKSYEELSRLSQQYKRFSEEQAKDAKRSADEQIKEAKRVADERGRAMERFASEARGFVGDVGDAVQQLGKGILGLSESEQIVADRTIYMSQKFGTLGGTLGQLLGPMGELVGTGVGMAGGGLLGYLSGNAEAGAKSVAELKKQQEELAKQAAKDAEALAKLQTENEAMTKSFAHASSDTIPGLISHMDDLDVQMAEVSKHLDGNSKQFEAWLERFGLLAKKEADDASQAGELIQGKIATGLSAANEALFGKPKTKSQLKEELTDLTDASNTYSIPALQKQLATLGVKIQDFKDKDGLSVSGNFTKEWNTEQEELNKKLSVAIDRQKEIKGLLKSNATAATKALKDEAKDFKEAFDVLSDSLVGSLGRDGVDAAKALEEALKGPRRVAEDLSKHITEINHGGGHEEPLIPHLKDTAKEIDDGLSPVERRIMKITGLTQDMADTFIAFGQDMASTFAGAAVNSVDAFFESVATGQDRTLKDRQAARAAFLRELGTQLIADGTKNELIGVGRGLFGDPSGWALAAWGLGEQATGFGFGGAGARAQRRQGYGDETPTAETGARGGSSGVGGLGGGERSSATPGTVIYQIYAGGAPGSTTINAGDGPASTAKAHRELTKIQSQGQRLGGGGFSRRTP